MNTFEITETVLDNYINDKLSNERIDFLLLQANEQINEISKSKEIYDSFVNEVNAPKKINNIILWILFMSNEDIIYDYIKKFNKSFTDSIPVSDLSDLLFYTIHLKKVKNIKLDGFDYLSEYEEEGLEEVDQYSFTNAFLFIQASKEIKMEF